jgi:hypothetical protein
MAAAAFGIAAAVILQEIHWLTGQPNSGELVERVELDDGRVYEDCVWVWNTSEEWQEYFPWLPPDTIRKHLSALEATGALVSFQKSGTDRTKRYHVDLDKATRFIEESEGGKNCHHVVAKIAACKRQRQSGMQAAKIATSSIKQRRLTEKNIQRAKDAPDTPPAPPPPALDRGAVNAMFEKVELVFKVSRDFQAGLIAKHANIFVRQGYTPDIVSYAFEWLRIMAWECSKGDCPKLTHVGSYFGQIEAAYKAGTTVDELIASKPVPKTNGNGNGHGGGMSLPEIMRQAGAVFRAPEEY